MWFEVFRKATSNKSSNISITFHSCLDERRRSTLPRHRSSFGQAVPASEIMKINDEAKEPPPCKKSYGVGVSTQGQCSNLWLASTNTNIKKLVLSRVRYSYLCSDHFLRYESLYWERYCVVMVRIKRATNPLLPIFFLKKAERGFNMVTLSRNVAA